MKAIAGLLVVVCLVGVAAVNSDDKSIAKVLFTKGPMAAYQAYQEMKKANSPEAIEERVNQEHVPLFAKYINEARVKAGLKPLILDKKLCEVARVRAVKMAQWGDVGHNIPGEGWPEATLKRFHITANVAENAGDYLENQSAWEQHNDFMRSPGHKANILEKGVVRMGIGIGIDKIGIRYVIEIFTDR